MNRNGLATLFFVLIMFYFALACLDYVITHDLDFWKNPDLLYQYWMALGIVVGVFSFGLATFGYLNGLPFQQVMATFITSVVLFVAGLLDYFYAGIAILRGEPYHWNGWSIQSRLIMPTWDWPQQILWTFGCLALIGYVWFRVLKK